MTTLEPPSVGGCLVGVNMIACSPRRFLYRTIRDCPTCQHRRRAVVRWSLHYGDDVTCLTCGDLWMDGYKNPRPTERGWKKKRLERARADFAAAMPEKTFRTWELAYIEDYFRDDEPDTADDSSAVGAA